MPKNKGRGGKNYKKGKHSGPVKRELLTKDEDAQLQYAIAIKMLGNGRILVKCMDELERIGNIRGKMKRKVWINPGDLLMVGLREFQTEKCDVILKYTPDQIRQLKALEEIPQDLNVNEKDGPDKNTDIQFNVHEDEADKDSESESEPDKDSEDSDDLNIDDI